MTTKDRDGNPLKVGDVVFFKSDCEQYGKIKSIRDNGWLVLVPTYRGETFDGGYIGGRTEHQLHPEKVRLDP